MTDLRLADYTDQRSLLSRPQWQVLEGRRRSDGVSERLTVFSAGLSCNAEFRRALKTELVLLQMLQHQGILRVLGTAESDGTLILRNSASDALSLREQLQQGRRFSADEVIDIGWQVCSALQRAHNLGLVHGGITAETVLLSEGLQASLVEFGFVRWLGAAERQGSVPGAVHPGMLAGSISREQVEADLRDLARLLSELLQSGGPVGGDGDAGIGINLERLLGRCMDVSGGQVPVTAREFQGRLGELLITPDSAGMPLVDERPPMSTAGKSIVKNLFDPVAVRRDVAVSVGDSATSAGGLQKLPFWAAMVVLVVLAVVAALLW